MLLSGRNFKGKFFPSLFVHISFFSLSLKFAASLFRSLSDARIRTYIFSLLRLKDSFRKQKQNMALKLTFLGLSLSLILPSFFLPLAPSCCCCCCWKAQLLSELTHACSCGPCLSVAWSVLEQLTSWPGLRKPFHCQLNIAFFSLS